MRFRNYWFRYRRGLTLIEVSAALALAGTLLVMMILAATRHSQQVRTAQQRLEAIEALDGLLAQWSLTSSGVPRSGSGTMNGPGGSSFRWSVRSRSAGELNPLTALIVRVEVFDGTAQEEMPPLAAVEVLTAGEKAGGPVDAPRTP